MRTFKQFLAEEGKELLLRDILHGECSAFFKQSKQNGLLVRGMKGYGEKVGEVSLGEDFRNIKIPLFKKTVRKDRRPMDTARPLHTIIDDWFEDEMGIRARSEAVFCFGEAGRENAFEYGTLVVVLPIGKFTYVWSPEVGDLYMDVISKKFETKLFPGKELKKEYIGSDGKPDAEKIREVMDGLGYTINGLDKAVAGSEEIMIDCGEYYVIPLPAHDLEYRDQLLGVIKKAFVKA